MESTLQLKVQDQSFTVRLYDSEAARSVAAAAPLTVSMSQWGDEYYGSCGISMGMEPDAREEMKVGELAFWPDGSALCIFFGPTPASQGDEPRAVGPVNPVGMIEGDPGRIAAVLKKLPASVQVTVST
jgi:hypothetical protein